MRDIEFRGINILTREFVYGDCVRCNIQGNDILCIKDTVYNVNNSKCNLIPTEVIKSTLGQYTGLKDKNGVKIFEGDIVKDHNGKGFIEYVSRFAGFRVNYYGNTQAKWFYDYNLRGEMESIEVIGNIHETKEQTKP